jgi:hypothetical protein
MMKAAHNRTEVSDHGLCSLRPGKSAGSRGGAPPSKRNSPNWRALRDLGPNIRAIFFWSGCEPAVIWNKLVCNPLGSSPGEAAKPQL